MLKGKKVNITSAGEILREGQSGSAGIVSTIDPDEVKRMQENI